jgi:hypothetical protein
MELIDATFRVTTVVVPVALYFLLLGLLNTRRCPQLLSGRQDFALLTVALSPLVLQPAVTVFGGGAYPAIIAACAIAVAMWLFAPRGHQWVIYNLSQADARQLILAALDEVGLEARTECGHVVIDDTRRVELSNFPALRNVSLRCVGGDAETWNAFAHALHQRLTRREVEPRPMAVAFLLVATAMIIVPMVMVVHQGPEIVRMLTDLLP